MKHRHLAVRSGARALAADVVARVLDDGAWAQPALASALSHSSLDARDKALCTELTYGTLRWAVSLEKSLLQSADKPGRGLDKRLRPHLLVAAYQIQHLGERIPARAAVNEAVDAVRAVRPGLEGFANALLRRLGSSLESLLPKDAGVDDVADALGIPRLLAHAVAPLVPQGDLVNALAGLNARPSTYALALADVPAEAARHPFVPSAFVVDGGAVGEAGGFKEGAFVVVDPGSAVAALLTGAREGQRVLDLCAAPGGKTVLLAHAVGERGRVCAVEMSAKRAERIVENIERTHVKGRVDVVIGDVINKDLKPADVVLLDAPCTGFGTTRRKPEIKLRRTAADVDADALVQHALLARAGALTNNGGVLVYSVCSPIPAEGVLQIDRFLSENTAFVVEDARTVLPWLPADAVDARGMIHLLPHRHDADAFFCARLRRKP